MLLLQICTCIFPLLPTGTTSQAAIVNPPKILCPILGVPQIHYIRIEELKSIVMKTINFFVSKRYDTLSPYMLNEWNAIKDKLLTPFVFLELSLYPHVLHFILPRMSLEPWVKYFLS